MEIGKLNQRIAILEHHTKVDEIGNHIARWEELFSCWASVNVGNTVGSAAEETNTGVTREIQKLEIIIRQSPMTMRLSSTTHRVYFQNVQYDITGIVPNYATKDYLKLLCVSRRAGDKDDLY